VALEAKKEHVYSSFGWKFSAAVPPALAGELRLNNVAANLATVIDVRKIDSDGADRTPIFAAVRVGDVIRIADWDNAAIIHRFNVTAVPTIGSTNITIPVAWVSGSGVLPTAGQAKINVGFLISLNV